MSILLGIILIFASYDSYESNKPDFFVVVFFYIWLIVNFLGEKHNYKNWQEQAKYDEFYKYFCEQWHPSIMGKLVCFWLALKFLNLYCFFAAFVFLHCIDLWERRYLTCNIKQDIIINKLSELQNVNTDY